MSDRTYQYSGTELVLIFTLDGEVDVTQQLDVHVVAKGKQIHVDTVEPRYSAHDREMSKSMLYQSVHYIEVLYITLKLNLNQSRHTTI